ncbi:UDP-N-acetylglucosamine-N-acetylmuramylpentapeptide N-acetylglucosamine transferase [Nitrosomonas ureae]|uniref:UDP-N-acetylglucosamine--N-acetylmuramyl-(pentapeptide) pyrophosphoryl-undecaprenol N-acetylglucosamine transferase n=1 Tax=Nitrosomonas ureae TaxID=44577 RepID=A0A286A8M7_9PROT|nr:undecaprenyldiphospho-muramoylpentapeptide beta-N-acetylglucosaminyltransferase [Nitrosomonas ureae]PXX13708.1 UDP-N-acetylglucosamine-N-acetylmuramylpentapeptide N-acetylglucosamine transferase [Nitrosomonas ureae]SOD18253.1 UDP-N-acetylglucosamine-N-acetylmuramylpentapeptide N-acetylglucosamine transferase [Nitrosomonas ureae]
MIKHTILIMAGGTGGHVFPGLAVADYLRQMGWHVVWLGTEAGMELKLVPQRGYDTEVISFSGLRGKSLVTWLMLPLRLIRAFLQSIKIIRSVKPDVVLGMGGYPAFPGAMMASLLNKPLIIHEQNSVPGLTNKILAKLADRVFLGFPDAILNNKKKSIYSGNPVRTEIMLIEEPEKRFSGRQGKLNLLIVGGSLGAQILNTIVPEALKLMPENLRPRIVHQAGITQFKLVQQAYTDLQMDVEVVAFIDDMASRYAACDLVLCRAGALTVAELSIAGVASILVPYPHAVDDHQTWNARFLSDHGAAVLIHQSNLTAKKLADLLADLSREKLLEMAITARSRSKPEATRVVAEACIELSGALNEA